MTVTWDQKRCIHAQVCVDGSPDMFNSERRPWIEPDAVEAVVPQYPTGAFHLTRNGTDPEPVPDENRIPLFPNGPGRLHLKILGTELIEAPLFRLHRPGSGRTPPGSYVAFCLTCDCPAQRPPSRPWRRRAHRRRRQNVAHRHAHGALSLRPLRQQAALRRKPRGGWVRDRLTGARSISLSPRETASRKLE